MAKRTGKDLAFTIASIAIAVMRGWSIEDQDASVDSTAAGDAVMDSDSLRGDYTVEWNSLLFIASPYVLPGNARGSKVAWAARIIAADTSGIISSTGRVDRFRIAAAYDGMVELTGIIKAAGTVLTYNTTPA